MRTFLFYNNKHYYFIFIFIVLYYSIIFLWLHIWILHQYLFSSENQIHTLYIRDVSQTESILTDKVDTKYLKIMRKIDIASITNHKTYFENCLNTYVCHSQKYLSQSVQIRESVLEYEFIRKLNFWKLLYRIFFFAIFIHKKYFREQLSNYIYISKIFTLSIIGINIQAKITRLG